MSFSMLMLIRKHPIMFLIGLYSPLAVVIGLGLVFYEPSMSVYDFVMLGIFSSVMGGIFFPTMLTFVIFMCCFLERGLDSKWLELGLRYAHEANGDGRDAHAVKAAKYFMKSALLFDDAAIVNLGLCYAYGFGVDKDPRKAAKCYRVAAEKKKDDYELFNVYRNIAQLALGLCYADGIGVERDKIKAEDLFCKAGKSFSLDYLWNQEEGVMWLREAGKKENAFAQYYLGFYYMSKKDYAESVKWYRKAAEQGNAGAQTALGHCYRDGIGVEKDEVESVKWYRKAAEQGNADAQTALGNCYRDGIGVAKDENEAVKWLNKAVAQGHAGARESLEKIDANSNQ